MATPNDQLFLNRFVEYNKKRYSNEPEFVAQLDALTLSNIQFVNFREVDVGGGVIAHFYDVVSPGLLRGVDQQFLPADYAKNGPASLENPEPILVDDITSQIAEGIYLLGEDQESSVGAIVVLAGKVDADHIKSIVKEKCFFDLKDDEIQVNEEQTLVTIDSRTIGGVLQIVESIYDGVARYNGIFRYDGEITY